MIGKNVVRYKILVRKNVVNYMILIRKNVINCMLLGKKIITGTGAENICRSMIQHL